ncbi:MAG TPA: hypothetical protein VGE01_14290, partial [Fimbriimonas sp.]
MPVPWIVLPSIPSEPIQTKIDEDLTVIARVVRYDRVNRIYRFREGVEARYGPTTVTADELEVHAAEEVQTAYARGDVRVVDPDGTLNARNLTFKWTQGQQTGQAEDVKLDFAGVLIEARTATLNPTEWTLTDVYGTSCRNEPPLFALRTPRIVLKPGRSGRIEKPSLDLLGQRLPSLPTQKFNLDPRTQGIRIPSVSYRKEDGLGVSWDSGWLVDPQTAVSASYAAYPGSRPSYGIQAARSSVPAENATRLIVPRSDLADRFDYSFFDSVEQASPKAEENILHDERNAVSVGSYWFQGSGNDRSDDNYTKPFEIAYERGGDFGAVGGVAQVRLQTIRRELEPVKTRISLNASAGPRPRTLAPGLVAYARSDIAGYLGAESSGWLRGQLGLTYQPVKEITLGASVHRSLLAGTPAFPIDELDSPHGGTARIDLNLGPTQFTHIWRYD